MEYAFSLSKLETIHVDEFLTLQGDSGYLIGRNLVVCDECRRNVYLNKGTKIKPYFSHYKESDESKKICTKRVKGYTKHYVRHLNRMRSKLRIGYFQQRFEDLIFLTLLNLFEKNNKYIVLYGPTKAFPDENGLGILKINKNNKLELLDHLRDMLFVSIRSQRSQKIVEILSEEVKGWISDIDNFKKLFKKSRNFLAEDKYWSKYDFETTGDNYLFAEETLKHLSTKNAKPLFHCLFVASLFFTLSLKTAEIYEKCTLQIEERLKSDCDFLPLEWIKAYSKDASQPPNDRNLLLNTIKEIDLIRFKTIDPELSQIFSEFLLDSTLMEIEENNETRTELISNRDRRWYAKGLEPESNALLELFGNSLRIFSVSDLAGIARKNYGDDMNSPEELLLDSTSKNRGFIYIAWSKEGKELWKKQLKEKSFEDSVKIGKSVDPERRRTELGGNYAPSDSIEIIDLFPVLDMKKAEDFIHNKLKKYRLSSNREVFGLGKEKAIDMVNDFMKNLK